MSGPKAIGVENNDFVGPQRAGPRNQRRTPAVVNTAFYPKLMWNGRFSPISGDPFDNSKGFLFPPPERTTRFPANGTATNGRSWSPPGRRIMATHHSQSLSALPAVSTSMGLSLPTYGTSGTERPRRVLTRSTPTACLAIMSRPSRLRIISVQGPAIP